MTWNTSCASWATAPAEWCDGSMPTSTTPRPSVRWHPCQPRWHNEAERDRLLRGMFETQPRRYAFFYLTTRLGLRTGEVYAISRDRIRDVPPTLIVDRAVQRGYKDRPAMLGSRKNHEVYATALGRDVLEVIRWHIDHGYAGPKFLFSQDGTFPKHLDSHKRPLRTVQKALGLPLLSHHQIGRHSMASQAATDGQRESKSKIAKRVTT